MQPLHKVQDQAKVESLAASIARDGWQGVALVADGDQLITGVHRYAACLSLGMQDAEIPTIDVRELFAANELDFEAIYAEESGDGASEWELAIVWTVDYLPPSIRSEYGIDLE